MAHRPLIWHLLAAPDRMAVRSLAQQARISDVMAQLLWQRGIRKAQEAVQFLNPKLSSLAPPEQLAGVQEAARRLVTAARQRRKICIYGDYDVDGIVGTAVLLRLLRYLQATVEYYIPLRQKDGYGLSAEKLRELHQRGIQTVVTVDCGIGSLAEAELAQQLGMELIITDHHSLHVDDRGGVLLPAASVVVHPRWPTDHYPHGELCGAGVAFKLAWEIARQASGVLSGPLPQDLRELLLDAVGLTAVAVVADAVPLRGENRVLVSYGLRRLVEQPPVGLKALMEVAELPKKGGRLSTEDVSYHLAPRLNAAGRIECARMSVDLLMTTSYAQAKTQAEFLDKLNSHRQSLERETLRQVRELLEREYQNDPAIVIAQKGWHPGVIGIVAARLLSEYGKPTVVIAIPEEGGVATGSCRSVPDLAIHEALRACGDLLESHGGHAAAAGLKIAPERIDAFRKAFNHYVARHLPGGTAGSRLLLDAEVPLSAITRSLLKELDWLEPYGLDNQKPVFLACDLVVERPRLIGKDSKRHVEFFAVQGGQRFRCIAWNMADRFEELQKAERVCIAFTPQTNTFNGLERIELQLVDFQCGRTPQLV